MKQERSDVHFGRCDDYPRGTTPVRIDRESNFSGYTHADFIALSIWDHHDDPSLMVEIDYDPFAGSSVPAATRSWGSFKASFR